MARQNEFVNYLLELLRPFGDVSSRAMFGGHGIYKEGLIFGIVIDDAFYLKADDLNRGDFEAEGLRPYIFQPKAGGKPVPMSYYPCPEDALENPALMLDWAKRGYAAALRKAAGKTAVRRTRKVLTPR